MSSDQSSDVWTIKAKKGASQSPAPNLSHAKPTTFFLKTEKELEQSMQRGRQPSRDALSSHDAIRPLPSSSKPADSSFGVHSLEETINSTFPDVDLSRTSSNSTDRSGEVTAESGAPVSRKRKVHPKIKSAGQRIISSEHLPALSSSTGSPVSVRSAESPFRSTPLRRRSVSSSVNLNQPLTPVRMSPHPHSAAPSTPRSTSPKSFRLSDEEASTSGETSEAAVLSDRGNVPAVMRTPQLVMPSLSMPARRPFTEQGRCMGRFKLMVAGPRAVGKTSFIQSILRLNEHIVHIDVSTPDAMSGVDKNARLMTTNFTKVSAATKPYPAWWAGTESSVHRTVGVDHALERNLTIIDTPPLSNDGQVEQVHEYFTECLRYATDMDSMVDNEFVGMLDGNGGTQIDALIYLFEPQLADGNSPADFGLSSVHQEFLRQACRWTNVIPLIGHADTTNAQSLQARREQITSLFANLKSETCQFGEDTSQPQAVSSAPGDDTDVIDASLLMSSQYLPPLAPSDLEQVVDSLFTPSTMNRLRHLSARKVVMWRKEFLKEKRTERGSDSMTPHSSHLGLHSPAVTSTGSMLDEPSKVLVPYGSASYYRSTSPTISDSLALPASAYALDYDHDDVTEPFREVVTARWAQDLTRSREKETRRYVHMFNSPTAVCDLEAGVKKGNESALVPAAQDGLRPARGRLGGKLGVIDPTDPLGVLAFSQAFGRRGVFALQIAGGCGLLAAVCYTVVQYWSSIQEFCGLGHTVHGSQAARFMGSSRVPPHGWDHGLRAFFGWDR